MDKRTSEVSTNISAVWKQLECYHLDIFFVSVDGEDVAQWEKRVYITNPPLERISSVILSFFQLFEILTFKNV